MCTGDHWVDTERGQWSTGGGEEILCHSPGKLTTGNFTARGRAASALWFGTGGNSVNPGNTKVELTYSN